MADTASAYRFAANKAVNLPELREARFATALESCPENETLLMINEDGPDDTDQISYHSHPLFKELSKKNPNRLECNHKHILACHFKHISDRISNRRIIEVADREFDDHFIFKECISANRDFVIRSNAFKNVQVSSELDWVPKDQYTSKYPGLPLLPDHACVRMSSLVDRVPLVHFKSILLDAKGRLTDEKSAKSRVNVSVGLSLLRFTAKQSAIKHI